MPRGDGRAPGSARPHKQRGGRNDYIPKGLRRRLTGSPQLGFDSKKPEWPEGVKTTWHRCGNGNTKVLYHRPGSQNPRK